MGPVFRKNISFLRVIIGINNMNWYKKSSLELSFENTHKDHHNGQDDFMLLARDKNNNNPIGGIEYSVFQDEIYINWMQVKKEYQRIGIGTSIYRELQRLNPEVKINWGMTTDEGDKFKQNIAGNNELV